MTALLHALALALWAGHLRRSGMHMVPVALLAVGLACVFTASPGGHLDTDALGGAAFMYLLVSVFSAYDRQPGLQALASSALLISAGVMTKPPIAISCLLVSLAFFLLHRSKTRSGAFGFALLMFTPATLCIVSTGVLALLTGSTLRAFPLESLNRPDASSASLLTVASVWWLALPLAVGLYRSFLKRTSAPDAAFSFMLFAVTALSFIPHMPQPLHRIDIFYLAIAGSAALFAQTLTSAKRTACPIPLVKHPTHYRDPHINPPG